MQGPPPPVECVTGPFFKPFLSLVYEFWVTKLECPPIFTIPCRILRDQNSNHFRLQFEKGGSEDSEN